MDIFKQYEKGLNDSWDFARTFHSFCKANKIRIQDAGKLAGLSINTMTRRLENPENFTIGDLQKIAYGISQKRKDSRGG